ncbi:amino acid ABC transporter ATP-binding protein [Candidatus Dependentiae bacterium]|nr:amino acid ABC transporter ATP-binding protein [Candidatus Dependentiae bacterium]
MLKLENIKKTFGNKKVIDSISFSVKKGEIAMLIGGSGVGKSTLLRILNNLETLNGGTVTLDNKPLDLKQVSKNHTIGMVFQGFNLFDHITVEQNITLPLQTVFDTSRKEAHAIAHNLLAHYGLEDKKNTYPQNLSGGQKQRLAIARSLAMKPKIICLDEPTSALDPLLTTHVANNIQELAKQGYIVLVASHDTELLKKLDCTIYLIEAGRIIETATSAEIKKNPQQFPKLTSFIAGSI